MELRERYEKETGKNSKVLGANSMYYVEWLEAKLSRKSEVSEAAQLLFDKSNDAKNGMRIDIDRWTCIVCESLTVPVENIELNDGRAAQIQIICETDEDKWIELRP